MALIVEAGFPPLIKAAMAQKMATERGLNVRRAFLQETIRGRTTYYAL
jgi:hypothetical protein